MVQVVTRGRTDLASLFELSGCLDGELNHHPFLAFVVHDDGVSIEVVSSAEALVAGYPPETPVMVQWPGKWHSDFFRMTVADVAAPLEAKRREWACARCGMDLRRKGWCTRERDGERVRMCNPCADTHDVLHPHPAPVAPPRRG